MRRPHAFTLIELLVVISIIAILVALLLPALGRARYTAQIVTCASNSRQVAVSAYSFASDNDGLLPALDNIPANVGPNPTCMSRVGMEKWLTYGMIDTRIWFCPQSSRNAHDIQDDEILATAPETVMDELSYFSPPKTWFVYPQAYWAQRTCDTNISIPWEPTLTDAQKEWPNRIEHPKSSEKPILSDRLYGRAGEAGWDDPSFAWGGHKPGQASTSGGVEDINAAYIDGHVTRIKVDAMRRNEVMGRWVNYY